MDLPDKSKPPGQQKKVVKPVITSTAKDVKRPASRRVMDSLISDSPSNVAKKVGMTILLPQLKGAVRLGLFGLIDGLLGTNGATPSNIVQTGISRGGGIQYSSVSTQSALAMAKQAHGGVVEGGYRDLELPTLQDAEMLLAGMYDLLNEYRVVAVGDLKEMANRTPAPSDNAMGWRSLDGARISGTGNGYVLELPRPVAI
jgi:hypothetical protein